MIENWNGIPNIIKPAKQEEELFISYFDQPKIMNELFCPIFRASNIAPKINALINGPVKLNISKFDIVSAGMEMLGYFL